MLATEASSRRRTWVGLAGFVALELATFVRYTNIVILGCAVVAVVVAWRLRAARLPLRTLCWWLASVAVFGAGVAVFDDLVYGGPLTTGYQPGEVTFSLGAIGPNLRLMPAHLLQAMPMLVLGLIALAWIVVRWLMLRRADGETGAEARRDLWVGIALAASWFAIWGLYSTYTWTTDPTNGSVSDVRFYVPAIGADRPARRLARDQASRPCLARRPDLNRSHHGAVRPRRLGLLRHVRSDRCPTTPLASRARFPARGLSSNWRRAVPSMPRSFRSRSRLPR